MFSSNTINKQTLHEHTVCTYRRQDTFTSMDRRGSALYVKKQTDSSTRKQIMLKMSNIQNANKNTNFPY